MKALFRHLVIVLVLLSGNVFGQSNFLRGTAEIATGNVLALENDLYLNTNTANLNNDGLHSQIRLRYDDMKILETAPSFTITVDFSVKKYDRLGNILGGLEAGSLTISHDANKKEVQEQQVYKGATGAYRIEVTVTGITGYGFISEDVILEAEMLYDRNATFNVAAVPTVGHTEYWNEGEVDFFWNYIQGAASYELEWVFLSTEVTQAASGDQFENATLVVTPNQHYRISVPYTSGVILYRVRGVSETTVGSTIKKKRTVWSANNSNNVGANVVYIGANNTASRIHEIHESWSYIALYSSNGLKSEQISYADATGRVRQQIVKDESNQNIIVGEQKYGFNGEPSIQVLPGIIPDSKTGFSSPNKLAYINQFTTSGGLVFDKMNFATDAKLTSTSGSDKLDESSSNYFSSANPFKGDGLHDYVATADGYGYAQTMFDAQGRVTKLSGVGEKFHMGGGKEVNIWYGNVSQDEIDRLFGNEVGYAGHYSKVMTQDANGVISTSYYNLSGQLIATALAGVTPSNLEDLDTVNYAKSTDETVDLAVDNEYSSTTKSNIVNYDFLSTTVQDYEFSYGLTRDWYHSACTGDTAYECKYILEVFVTDNQDNRMTMHISQGANGTDSSTTNYVRHLSGNDFASDDFVLKFTSHLKVGQYKIWKKLQVDPQGYQDALNKYKNTIINDGSLACNISGKQLYIDKYIKMYEEGLRCDPCEQGCSDFANAYYTYREEHPSFTINDALTADTWQNNLQWTQYEYSTTLDSNEWTSTYNACLDKNCTGNIVVNPTNVPAASCDGMLNIFWKDLSPGGQYFDNAGVGEDNNFDLAGTTPTDKNVNPNDGWLSAEGLLTNDVLSGVPAEAAVDRTNYWTARQTWNSNALGLTPMSSAMVTYLSKHPEFCEYTFCSNTRDYQVFTSELMSMTYAQAAALVSDPMGTVNNIGTKDLLKIENATVFTITGNTTLHLTGVPSGVGDDWNSFIDYYYAHPSDVPGVSYMNCSPSNFHELAVCMAEAQAGHTIQESDPDDKELVWNAYKTAYLSIRGKYFAAVKTQYKATSECHNGLSLVTKIETNPDVFNNPKTAPYKYTETVGTKQKTFALRFPDFSLLQVDNSTDLVNFIQNIDTTTPYGCSAERSAIRESNWFFGYNTMGQFPLTGNTYGQMDGVLLYSGFEKNLAYEGTATISDANGKVQYYSNGRKIWKAIYDVNGNYQPSSQPVELTIPVTGTLLAGNEDGASQGTSAIQGVMFVKHPANDNLVYVFTVDDALTSNGNVKGFNYSVLDLQAGTVTEPICLLKNGTQPIRTTEQMDATMHSNGNDIWITVRGSGQDGTNNFKNLYSFQINSTTILAPVVSTFNQLTLQSTDPGGTPYTGGAGECDRGALRFSPDGTKAATVNQMFSFPDFNDAIVIYDFDKATGYFSNAKSVAAVWRGGNWTYNPQGNDYPQYKANYDCEFSPNGKGLFVSAAGGNSSSNSAPLLWVDLNDNLQTVDEIYNNIRVVSNNSAINCDIKIGPDGNLYQSVFNEQYLHVFTGDLNNPTLGNFNPAGKDIAGTAKRGFSNQFIAEKTCNDTTIITELVPDCLCKQLLNYRNDYWKELYGIGADTIWNTTPANETAVSDLIVGKYKKLYPTVSIVNGNNITQQSSKNLFTSSMIKTWEEGCLTQDYTFEETVFPELKSDCPKFDCFAEAEKRAQIDGETEWSKTVEMALFNFGRGYDSTCLRSGNVKETFQMHYLNTEYQYTLYYYDLAGNLVATVYPEGVRILDTNQVNRVQAYRNTGTDLVQNPTDGPIYLAQQHVVKQVNSFTYNTLGEVLTSHSVDAGNSKFYYDNLGRLIVSQNAQQAAGDQNGNIRYSYTNFDEIGRITETGEFTIRNVFPFNQDIARGLTSNLGISSYEGWLKLGTKSEVTLVKYDDATANTSVRNELLAYGKNSGLKHNRNRISSVFFFEKSPSVTKSNYDNAYYYSYNEHGLAETFVQEHVALSGTAQRFKTLNYDFDLFTGLVSKVTYQGGKEDQFYSKYEYDQLQRLKNTYTSQDNVLWNLESKNIFYVHGAKARIELGKHQVQGIDLAYTIRGQLKGMNSATLSARRDIGSDGQTASVGTYQGYTGAETGKYKTTNKYFGRDAAGFTLGYFKGDYQTVGVVHGQEMFEAYTPDNSLAGSAKDLYNGSISSSATAIYNRDANLDLQAVSQLSLYSYDVMYRLKEVQVLRTNDVLTSNNWQTAALEGGSDKTQSSYYSHIKYDMNGNITELNRNTFHDGTTAEMDKLNYSYHRLSGDLQSNRLYHVKDDVSGKHGGDYDATAALIGNIESDNYFTYDSLGNIKENRADGYKIDWTASRKIKKLTRLNSTIAGPNLEFKYDAFGRRICKIVKPRSTADTINPNYVEAVPSDWEYEYYALDGSGNTLAIYQHKMTISNTCGALDSSSTVLYFGDVSTTVNNANPNIVVTLSSIQGSEGYPLVVTQYTGVNLRDNFVSQVNANTSSNYSAELAPEICATCVVVKYHTAGTIGNNAFITLQSNSTTTAVAQLKTFAGGSESVCAIVNQSILKEQFIYTDSRLGALKQNKTLTGNAPASTNIYTNVSGRRYYEIVNWLGSVISIVKDMKYWETSPVDGTIFTTSFEGGDESLFRSSSDAQYVTTTSDKVSGEKSLALEAQVGMPYGHFGPNIRENVKSGNTIDIECYTKWQGTTSQRGGGIVYALIDENNNFLRDANGNQQWREITLAPNNGDNAGSWNYQQVNGFIVPTLYKADNSGQVYDGTATLHVFPWVANSFQPTLFDDLKVSISRSNEQEEYFAAVVEEAHSYFEFGMRMSGIGFGSGYSRGYQGSEMDNEISGEGASITTLFRQLDPRLGRWFSVDPVFQPWQSPYTSMDNNPINGTDVNGDKYDPFKGDKLIKSMVVKEKGAEGGGYIMQIYRSQDGKYHIDVYSPSTTSKYGKYLYTVHDIEYATNTDGSFKHTAWKSTSYKSNDEATASASKKKAAAAPAAEPETDWWDIGKTVLEVAIGFTPLGVVVDVYDLGKAIASGDPEEIALATVGFIPGGDIVKGAKKILNHTDELSTAAKKAADLAKVADNVSIPPTVIKSADNVVEEVKAVEKQVTKQADDVVDEGTKKAEEVIPTTDVNVKKAEVESPKVAMSIKKIGDGQANTIAENLGYVDAHDFKESFVGTGNISKYDMFRNTDTGEIILKAKQGKNVIYTGEFVKKL